MGDKIYVGDDDLFIQTVDGTQMTVKPLFVEHNDTLVPLRDCEGITGVNDISFILLSQDKEQVLRLPKRLRISIAWFLEQYHAKVNMDYMCFDFGYHVAYGKDKAVSEFDDGDWDCRAFNPKQPLKQGNILMLHQGRMDGITSFVHAAVYLGKGLFISIYGAGGNLEVSTLEAMKRDFDAHQVVRAIPHQ